MNFQDNKIISYNVNNTEQNNLISEGNAIDKGKKILEGNDFLKDLSDLMEDSKFNNFFKKYMHDFIGIKSTVTYMKLYSELKNKYRDINDEDLDKNIIIFLLTKIIRNKELLPISIKTIDNILLNGKLDFFEELERNIIQNNIKVLNE